jgi:pilus assembly protein CpaB
MNRKRLLFIGFLALVLGAVVSISVYNRLQAKVTPAKVNVDVVVAANDIQVGAKIGEQDLKIAKYLPDDLPSGVFHVKTSVAGHGAVLPIHKGEFVLPDKLSAGPGLPSLIAVGMRAEAVRVNDVTAVGGFAGPGTRVDVLVTGNPAGSSEPQTETILQNILVLAVGAKTDRSQTGEPQNATVVTLLVSPEDAEKLALASQEGRIQLVLRNSGDTKQETTPAIKNTNLFSGANPKPAKPKRVKPTPTHAPETPNLLEIEMIKGPQKETIRLKQ